MTVTPREEILTEAATLITGDRNKSYGSPTENFANTAALWNVQIGHKLKKPLTPSDVAQLMTQLKMARLIASHGKRDNWADAVGYLACGWETEVAAMQSVAELAERAKADAAALARGTVARRYFLDFDGWYWRWDETTSSMTYVTAEGRPRIARASTRPEDLIRDLHPAETPFAEVPEWAR